MYRDACRAEIEFLVIFEGFFTFMEQNSGEISQLQG